MHVYNCCYDYCNNVLLIIGGRTAQDIVSWVIRNSGPSTTTLSSLQEAKDIVEREEVVLIGYFESTDSVEAMAYTAAADSLSESTTFGITTDMDVIQGMEADVNTVVLYKKVWITFDKIHVCQKLHFTIVIIINYALCTKHV